MNKILKKIISYILLLLIIIFSFRLYVNSGKEVVKYENFTDYFQTGESENGGLEITTSNFTTFEKEYNFVKEEENKKSEVKKDEVKTVIQIEYKIQKNDTIAGIAKKFGLNKDTVKINNPNIADNRIKVGTVLTFPSQDGLYYKIQKGETLSKIGKKYGVSVVDIVDNNSINPKKLKAGTTIFLKGVNYKKYKEVEDRLIAASNAKDQKKNTSATTSEPKKTKPGNIVVDEDTNINTSSEGFAFPVRYTGVSSPFGNRYHPVLKRYILHTGVDLNAKYIPLRASKDGVVTFAGYMNGYGKIIIIKHSNGYETRYAHLSVISTNVGERVKQGELIGKTGNSGRVTGPHLHFEIRLNGVPRNPMKYLR